MIDTNCKDLSIARQCDLLLINKSTYYYKSSGELLQGVLFSYNPHHNIFHQLQGIYFQ